MSKGGKGKQKEPNTYLLNMSISDISLLFLALPSIFIESINIDTDSQYNAGPSESFSHNTTSISTQ